MSESVRITRRSSAFASSTTTLSPATAQAPPLSSIGSSLPPPFPSEVTEFDAQGAPLTTPVLTRKLRGEAGVVRGKEEAQERLFASDKGLSKEDSQTHKKHTKGNSSKASVYDSLALSPQLFTEGSRHNSRRNSTGEIKVQEVPSMRFTRRRSTGTKENLENAHDSMIESDHSEHGQKDLKTSKTSSNGLENKNAGKSKSSSKSKYQSSSRASDGDGEDESDHEPIDTSPEKKRPTRSSAGSTRKFVTLVDDNEERGRLRSASTHESAGAEAAVPEGDSMGRSGYSNGRLRRTSRGKAEIENMMISSDAETSRDALPRSSYSLRRSSRNSKQLSEAETNAEHEDEKSSGSDKAEDEEEVLPRSSSRYSFRDRSRILRVRSFGEKNSTSSDSSSDSEEEEEEVEEEIQEEEKEVDPLVPQNDRYSFRDRSKHIKDTTVFRWYKKKAETTTAAEDDDEEEGEGEDTDNEKDDGANDEKRNTRYALRNRQKVQRYVLNVTGETPNTQRRQESYAAYAKRVEQRAREELRRERKSLRGGTSSTRRTSPSLHRSKSRKRHRRKQKYSSSTSSSSTTSSSDSELIGMRRPSKHEKSHSGGASVKPINGSNDLQRADAMPLTIDTSVTWDSIGGLQSHIQVLKEMVMLPLLYPEVYERYNISPARGVVFHGPPGTGKTLTARALANTCSQGGRRVAFFMRKGADCLSKWVGEAEKQLRLLFNEARRQQPSIIFFDEIDGLAPVRSSKQDQIHASIVSTLLALMDGLDSRGQVLVIGATNRIDAIDPALRRPGRFDRELYFGLPKQAERKQIIDIHTREWKPLLTHDFKLELAARTVGYCGADIKALCAEAALSAIRGRYPQIYQSHQKLVIDPASIIVRRSDFVKAMGTITPTSHRSAVTYASALPDRLEPLLSDAVEESLRVVRQQMPLLEDGEETPDTVQVLEDMVDHAAQSITEQDGPSTSTVNALSVVSSNQGRNHSVWGVKRSVYRPRLLISGRDGMAAGVVASAVLHGLESVPIISLDLPKLLAEPSASTMEEALVRQFTEARRHSPCILFLPQINIWWSTATELQRSTLQLLLREVPSDLAVLFLATASEEVSELQYEIIELFNPDVNDGDQEMFAPDFSSNAYAFSVYLQTPTEEQRQKYFANVITLINRKPKKNRSSLVVRQALPPLPVAPPPPEEESKTEDENDTQVEKDQHHLRELRIFLDRVLEFCRKEKRYAVFARRVDPEEVADYYALIKHPMDLETMCEKVDNGEYLTLEEFMDDIKLIVSNAQQYNPCNAKDSRGRQIVHNACSMQDQILSYAHRFKKQQGYDLFARCREIAERAKGGGKRKKSTLASLSVPRAPTKTALPPPPPPSALSSAAAHASGSRVSARLRGEAPLFAPPLWSDPEEIYRASLLLSKTASGDDVQSTAIAGGDDSTVATVVVAHSETGPVVSPEAVARVGEGEESTGQERTASEGLEVDELQKEPLFKVQDTVVVASRTQPGVNKPGGSGFITSVNTDGTYDVRYVLGGRERRVEEKYIKIYVPDEGLDKDGDARRLSTSVSVSETIPSTGLRNGSDFHVVVAQEMAGSASTLTTMVMMRTEENTTTATATATLTPSPDHQVEPMTLTIESDAIAVQDSANEDPMAIDSEISDVSGEQRLVAPQEAMESKKSPRKAEIKGTHMLEQDPEMATQAQKKQKTNPPFEEEPEANLPVDNSLSAGAIVESVSISPETCVLPAAENGPQSPEKHAQAEQVEPTTEPSPVKSGIGDLEKDDSLAAQSSAYLLEGHETRARQEEAAKSQDQVEALVPANGAASSDQQTSHSLAFACIPQYTQSAPMEVDEEPDLGMEEAEVVSFVKTLVEVSRGWTVERLEKLRSRLSTFIHTRGKSLTKRQTLQLTPRSVVALLQQCLNS